MRVGEPDWCAGKTVACIASGPSLTPDDVALIERQGMPAIVTNNTYRLAPWADALFGFDLKWWRQYGQEAAGFAGERLTISPGATKFGARLCPSPNVIMRYGNSGAAALALALQGNPSRVLLLGYDAKKSGNGKAHWHEDHPAGLSNCKSIGTWGKHFELTAMLARRRDAIVLNVSRETAIRCFQRAKLEDVL